jgi:hypothetical protein
MATVSRNYSAIRKHCDQQREELEKEFNALRPHLLDIAKHCYYPAVKGLNESVDSSSDSNESTGQGDTNRLDNHATMCLRRGAAGFHANLTSPSRQWFRIGATSNSEVGDKSAIRKHMDDRTETITEIIRKSGSYKEFHTLYNHLMAFGFGCLLVVEDTEIIQRCIRPICLRMGTYALGNGKSGKVNRLIRRFSYNGRKMLQEFGNDLTKEVKEEMLEKPDQRWLVYNLIEPDKYGEAPADSMTQGMRLSTEFQFRSIYWIAANKKGNSGIIRITGYTINPIIAPRMDREHGDVYGIGRGHEALALMKGLDATIYDGLQMSSHAAEPPVQASSDFADKGINLDRGGINISGNTAGESSFIKAIDLNAGEAIKVCEFNQDKLEDKISRTFYNDIFSAITMSGADTRMTAAEIYQRTSESLLMLGPVLSSIDDEFLDPFINLVSFFAEKNGIITVPPDIAEDIADLDIEYISSVHLAQKASELGVLDRFMSFTGGIGQVMPTVLENVNYDSVVRLYASMLGVKEECLTDLAATETNRKRQRRAAATVIQNEQGLKEAETLAKVGGTSLQGTVAGALAGIGGQQ